MIIVSLRPTIDMVLSTVRIPRILIKKWVVATLLIFRFLTFGPPRGVHADEFENNAEFCPGRASVDLTNATRNVSGFLAQSGYFFPQETARSIDGTWRGCICDLKPCLNLCPPLKTATTKNTHFPDDWVKYSAIPHVYNTNLTIDDDEERSGPKERFHFVTQDPCPSKKKFFLCPKTFGDAEFYLLRNGSLFRPRMNISKVRFLDSKKYCLRLLPNESSYTPKVCTNTSIVNTTKIAKTDAVHIMIQYVGSLISVPFLIMTLIVYSVLPELRNIYGATLRCYLCCLIVTYVTLAVRQISGVDSSIISRSLGFIAYFSFIANFLWLNVMCIDIWWRFGNFQSLRDNSAAQDRKKFIGYSIYAWGVAIVLTVITDAVKIFPEKKRRIVYYCVPIGLTIACNICLYISTSIRIVQHNRIMRRYLNNGDSRSHDDNKNWFSLHLKLFFVMGVSWSMEIMGGFLEGPKYFWYIASMINVFHGIFIFVIFVCKKNIWLSLKKRFGKENLCVFRVGQLPCSICISGNTTSKSPESGVTYEQGNPSGDFEKNSPTTRTTTLD